MRVIIFQIIQFGRHRYCRSLRVRPRKTLFSVIMLAGCSDLFVVQRVSLTDRNPELL